MDSGLAAEGRTAVVTGATSGLGLAIATGLVERGWQVVAHGPDSSSAREAAEAVGFAQTGAVHPESADFADLDQVRALAARIRTRYGRVDALVNNAAVIHDQWTPTQDGVDRTFAVNFLGPYLLTRLLLPAVLARPGGRILIVASEAHRGTELDLERAHRPQDYERFASYQRSKLAALMFAYELARRTEAARVSVMSADPGMMRTGLFRPRNLAERIAMPVINLKARPPEHAASPLVDVLDRDDVSHLHGAYVRRGLPAESSSASRDLTSASLLWDWSAQQCGLATSMGGEDH